MPTGVEPGMGNKPRSFHCLGKRKPGDVVERISGVYNFLSLGKPLRPWVILDTLQKVGLFARLARQYIPPLIQSLKSQPFPIISLHQALSRKQAILLVHVPFLVGGCWWHITNSLTRM